MSWLSTSGFEPALPAHCAPQNDFLLRFSSTFHTCVPTPLAFLSNSLGTLSIISWLFAQIPQIYKNYAIQSTSGLSIGFLVVWCLGDISNLLGALFTHQASWQVTIGAYYVFVDLCLVGQWVWYERLRHGRPVFRVWNRTNAGRDDDFEGAKGAMEQVVIEGADASTRQQAHTRPRIIFRTPTFQREPEKSSYSNTPNGNTIYRVGASSSPMPSPSPRTMLFLACLVAIAQASPIKTDSPPSTLGTTPTPLETAGTILSWCSTLLYLGSRLPQLFKNYRLKSTAGLSPHLFIAAFMGNLFYSSALATNPNAWSDFSSYGGGGWAGPEGNDRAKWVLAAAPFFLGAFGVLGLDGSVGVQFLMYGEEKEAFVVEEEGGASRWRRVSGWMRGWVPGSFGVVKTVEGQALLDDGERNRGYGAA
ncbi:putative vacuolar amino acid transporter [Fulvia fulva]|uniref:Vacuolar amino acid transporter n=1 Tax=Passalora fulva TaxID=5499 RepID=A0A9Q8P4X3_PASFU|nr:putative vacuolar amino acid transporter [Fulvia fulva]KAK4631756.1 putative vacuolar amino acid transporter [Fulvia fulva]KAK4633109.1 putative vacuolar amino acid transporter [Fulvia fulva]UJO13545.1 putative vacuolar amino acid transporter [Fulvia fulva]WPV11647.1 putative vacuolar amino acid transporter [Fulvia fulva]WPV26761.1 putative vacuolar amino acid transporter [Fulvia fulva]